MIRALFAKPHSWAEVWSAIVIAGWGIWNCLDPVPLQENISYALVMRFVPDCEWILEIITVAIGVWQFVALVIDRPVLRLSAAMMACFVFSMFCISFLNAESVPPGTVFVVGWAGANVFAIMRAAKGLP